MEHGPPEAAVLAIERPHPKLWTYCVLCCLVALPAAPVLLPLHWFRYRTMRYHFTAEGVSMSRGILFRRQTLLNYARIQDIHLESNFVERWLRLARLQRFRETRLGDPDELPRGAGRGAGREDRPELAAAQGLLAEARALRSVLR
ncbi:MAG: PH domain-containing protein [Verrucomicrobiota bacterium]